jgi:hypothetical protein
MELMNHGASRLNDNEVTILTPEEVLEIIEHLEDELNRTSE